MTLTIDNMDMNIKRVRTILVNRAKNGEIITYSELCDIAALPYRMNNPHDRVLIGDLLEIISTDEFIHGRPLLSSIVLTKDNEEGDGFYKMAEKLGFGNWQTLKKDFVFATEMIKNTFEYWETHNDESN